MRDPLLLIHGFTDTGRTWHPLLPRLIQHHYLMAPTLVGHYGGPPIPEGMSDPLGTMADGLEQVLDEAGHEKAHLVGNSLGGWLAFVLAERGRALSVVALSPGHGWPEDAPPAGVRRRFMRANRAAPHAARYVDKIVRRPRLRYLALRDVIAHPQRVSPEMAKQLILGAANCPMFDPYVEQVENAKFRREFGDLGVPVRIAWGKRDLTLPFKRCSAWFRDSLPDAEWVDLPDCGHLPQHDDPDLVARTILEVTKPAVKVQAA